MRYNAFANSISLNKSMHTILCEARWSRAFRQFWCVGSNPGRNHWVYYRHIKIAFIYLRYDHSARSKSHQTQLDPTGRLGRVVSDRMSDHSASELKVQNTTESHQWLQPTRPSSSPSEPMTACHCPNTKCKHNHEIWRIHIYYTIIGNFHNDWHKDHMYIIFVY